MIWSLTAGKQNPISSHGELNALKSVMLALHLHAESDNLSIEVGNCIHGKVTNVNCHSKSRIVAWEYRLSNNSMIYMQFNTVHMH